MRKDHVVGISVVEFKIEIRFVFSRESECRWAALCVCCACALWIGVRMCSIWTTYSVNSSIPDI